MNGGGTDEINELLILKVNNSEKTKFRTAITYLLTYLLHGAESFLRS